MKININEFIIINYYYELIMWVIISYILHIILKYYYHVRMSMMCRSERFLGTFTKYMQFAGYKITFFIHSLWYLSL